MPDSGVRVEPMLDGFAKFLNDKDLALAGEQPYLVRWVRELLLFAREHAGYTFEGLTCSCPRSAAAWPTVSPVTPRPGGDST